MYFEDKVYKTFLVTLEGKHKTFLLALNKEDAEKKILSLYIEHKIECKKEPKIEEIPQVNTILGELK